MSFTTSEENYIKSIYHLQQGSNTVTTNELAAHLQTRAASVTDMLKKLKQKELLIYEKYQGFQLSTKGKKLALNIIRKHRLWEYFLVHNLNFGWDEVHEIAEELEHINSSTLIERLDEYLRYPKFDPHGDPIPTSKGKLPARARLKTLAECDVDRPLRVARVLDQDPQFLQFIERNQLKPGMGLTVRERNDFADAVAVELSKGGTVTLGVAAAAKILVEPGEGKSE